MMTRKELIENLHERGFLELEQRACTGEFDTLIGKLRLSVLLEDIISAQQRRRHSCRKPIPITSRRKGNI